MSEGEIQAYLAFGSPPIFNQYSQGVLDAYRSGARGRYGASTRDFNREFLSSIEQILETNPDGKCGRHCVLLSGGRDSRAVLAGLLKYLNTSELVVATYGQSVGEELQIAREVADRTGVDHEVLELDGHRWSRDEFVDYLSHNPGLAVPTGPGFFGWKLERFLGPRLTYWSGFFGDAVTGAHLPRSAHATWGEAISAFVDWNVVSKLIPLTAITPARLLPEEPLTDASEMEYTDQLDLLLRQQCRIRKANLHNGFRIMAPFSHDRWIRYAGHLPRESRVSQRLYKAAVRELAPGLFSIPTAGGSRRNRLLRRIWRRSPEWLGKRMHGIGRLKGLVDAGRLPAMDLDRSEALRRIVQCETRDFAERGLSPWMDVEQLWKLHDGDSGQTWRVAAAEALRHVAGVELMLKCQKDAVT